MSKRIALAFVVVVLLSAGLLFVRPPQARAGSSSAPVLLIHGWNPNSAQDCDSGSEWGTVETYFRNHGVSNAHSEGFYTGDTNCWDHLNLYDGRCSDWYDSGANNGTVNEDIRHRSCLLAWRIWDYWSQYDTTIEVVAHSMGGILIRQAMNDTPWVGAFPPYLRISDVVTAGSPHQGLLDGTAWAAQQAQWVNPFYCPPLCFEISQLEKSNPLMSNLNSTSFRNGFARNPQGRGGADWTTMSSNNDEVLRTCDTNMEHLGAPGDVARGGLCGLMPGCQALRRLPWPVTLLWSRRLSHRFQHHLERQGVLQR